MRIATVGKGGAGKTTIAGTLARILAKKENRILAIDGDPNPNLALTLGISREKANNINFIPHTVMKLEEDDYGEKVLKMSLSENDLFEKYGTKGPDNIDLIVMGHPADGTAGSGWMCASHRAVRGLIVELTGYCKHTITDMEAGLEHLKRGTAKNVDMMIIVVEPYYRSLEAGMRTFKLAKELNIKHLYVASNKFTNETDENAIKEFCEKYTMPIISNIPYDSNLIEAERNEKAPYDYNIEAPSIKAIYKIADWISTH